MKKFFRLVSMLAVAGLTLAYTSCTDYSKDIDENSEEIQSLSNELATAKQQIESMKTDISNLQAAKSEVEKAIAALQTSLTTLQSKQDADEKEVAEIKATIENLQKSVTDLNAKVKSIEEAIKALASKQDLEDAKAWVESTFVTLDSMKVVNEALGALEVRLQAAESKITSLEGKYDSELKISEILAKIETAQNAADSALTHSKSVLGKVEALQSALGVYAQDGVLKAKIEALEAKDSELADSLSKKLNASDFKGEFDKAFKDAIEDAVAEDGVVGQAIASKISAAKTELEGKINALKDYVNTKFDYLYTAVKQLRSLVFVPDLYVDGIEATEYTYANYEVITKLNTTTAEKTYTEYGNGKQGVTAYVPKGTHVGDNTYDKYASNSSYHKDKNKLYFKNPASVVTYKMNPSTADVNATTPLAFVSDDKEFVTTRTSVNKTSFVEFVSAEDGELKVRLNAESLNENYEGTSDKKEKELVAYYSNKVSIFALQATVKNGEGQDTTVTSDYARLYLSSLNFDALAFAQKGKKAVVCDVESTQNHVYSTLADAITNAPSVKVEYDETLDLDDIVTTHYSITRPNKNNDAIGTSHGDYDADLKDGIIDDYGVTYEYQRVDYQIGTSKTSETQHILLNGSVITPCGVTTDKGTSDSNATGADALQSVGRRPIVRVIMKVDGKIVKVGFIKFEIVKVAGRKVTDPFEWTFRFYSGGYYNVTTWPEIANKVLKVAGLTKEEFNQKYVLETDKYNYAVQYMYFDGKFEKLPYPEKKNPLTLANYGTVTENKADDKNLGTTTDVLKWNLDEFVMSDIYEKFNGHKVTIYVRFKLISETATTTDKGIYVPLTAIVDKPVTTVGKKLSNYWFSNGEGISSVKVNVAVPFNVESASAKENNVDAADPTKPWKTDINQVWEGNKPTIDFGDFYKKYQDGTTITYNNYKYYFAPQQQKFTIDGYTYQLVAGTSVKPSKSIVYDMYKFDASGQQVSKAVVSNVANDDIVNKEQGYAIDVTKGIYNNDVLWCVKVESKYASNADWRNWSFNVENIQKIATLSSDNNCVVEYNSESDVAKFLLNNFESDPTTQYAKAGLFANIGVVAYEKTENIVLALNGAINPYYFLRPVNAVAATGKFFIDSEDQHVDESNVDIFNTLTFKDWRGAKFVDFEAANLADSLKNQWYFKFYNINSVEVDIAGVTTDFSGGTLGSTKLTSKTSDIKIEHWTGERVNPTVVSKIGKDNQKALTIELNTPANPTEWAKDAKVKYEWLVKKFGYIHYHNNGTQINEAFTLRVPVKFTYTWGTINTYVDITVKPYGSK